MVFQPGEGEFHCISVYAASGAANLRNRFLRAGRLCAAKDACGADVLVDLWPMHSKRRQFNHGATARRGRQEAWIPPERRAKDAAVGQRHDQAAIVALRRDGWAWRHPLNPPASVGMSSGLKP